MDILNCGELESLSFLLIEQGIHVLRNLLGYGWAEIRGLPPLNIPRRIDKQQLLCSVRYVHTVRNLCK